MKDRYLDLLKQGFMKRPKVRANVKVERKIIACDKCHDWHWTGKHTKKGA